MAAVGLNVLAGNVSDGLSWDDHRRAAAAGLKRLAPIAEQAGVLLLIEALNAVQNPRYFLTNSRAGFELVREVGSPAVKFQYDVYHLQIMEGNLIDTISRNVAQIGHVQIGDVPGRHEPEPARSTTRTSLQRSIEPATTATSAWSTFRPARPSQAWSAGCPARPARTAEQVGQRNASSPGRCARASLRLKSQREALGR